MRSRSSTAAGYPTGSSCADGRDPSGSWRIRTSPPKLWAAALELARAGPPQGPRCLIHRDYHPENTLWSRGRLTGVVDWTSASWGPAAIDTAHMRWEPRLTYGLDAADEFLRLYRSLTSRVFEDKPYWDVITLLDLVAELDPDDWTRFELARLEHYLERVLAGMECRKSRSRHL